jgi:aldehyde oxidoreductase
MALPISITVNGVDHTLDVGPGKSLLDVLRDDLGLTGAKRACDNGECGSCTVMLAGKSAMSCVIPARRAAGKEVLTIEGLAAAYRAGHSESCGQADLHPLQRSFADSGAAQCGFCIPGMIMEAVPLLERVGEPTRADVARRLARNLCRCTGYVKIIDAVLDASAALRGHCEPTVEPPAVGEAGDGCAPLGARIAKYDSEDHVTGRSRYAADLAAHDALHVKVVRSPHHHARIVNIDTSQAESLPGVKLVLTAADLPEHAQMLAGRPQPFLLAVDKVRFAGEAVVAIAAESAEIADEAVRLVQIDYEVLRPVLDPGSALDPCSEPIHPPSENWTVVSDVRRGDVDAEFARSAAVVEGVYRTAPREHAPMEPEAGVARMEDGVLVIRTPHHHPFAAQHWIARLVGLDPDEVRIICPAMGGNFGHRGDFLHSGLLALTVARTGRPARIVYTREDSLLGSAKAMSYLIKCRTAADKDGHLTAMEAEIIADGGCWIKHRPAGQRAGSSSVAMFAPGPYRMPAARILHLEACTNRPRSIPMRGTNIPDLAFAWESQMDMLAERLGIDLLEFRIRNALENGDSTVTGEVLDESVSAKVALEALRKPYALARERASAAPASQAWRRGIGFAAIWMSMGGGRFEEAGGDWHGLKLGPARAAAALLDDGRIRLRSGIVEKGQGIAMAVRQIAAAELGVPPTMIEMVYGDTALAPFPIATSGQRTMFHAGGAAQLAARQLREAMLAVGAERLAEPADDLAMAGREIISRRTGARLPLVKVAHAFRESGASAEFEAAFTLKPSETGQGPIYSYAAQLVELEVSIETGEVHVDRATYVADPGTVINWQTFEGQVEGGVVMGLSYGLSEAFVPGQTRTLKDYKLPCTRHVPEQVDIVIVEQPVDGGPFGAKGVAEMTASAGIASASNAIAAAIGARCYQAPSRPEVIRAALGAADDASRQPAFPELSEEALIGETDKVSSLSGPH